MTRRHSLATTFARKHGIFGARQTQLLAEAAGGPKLLVEPGDLKQQAGRSNRGDLHTNVFDYLVRRWRCVCGGQRVDAPQVTTFESRRKE
ncbi:MAG TPA: hypothetical protein VGH49_04700 [Xanthobacteraceae bacterium]